MQIGPYTIDNPLALAPMAGVTDRWFRGLCRELGAGYLVSEMLTANPALRDTRTSRQRGDFAGEPQPFAVQIAGSDPDWMAAAAAYNVARGARIIDINMGCPAKNVCNRQAGSALLSDPVRVEHILQAVVRAVPVPVTLKMRTGPDPAQRNGVVIARMAERAGIAALAVHGRTRADRFKGAAEHATLRDICQAVSIPVFANGDIDTPEQAAQVLRSSGAAGVMVGRAAQGNPWIFRQIRHFLATGLRLPPPAADEVHRVMQRHLQQLHQAYGEAAGVRVARKHIGWYLHARPGYEAYRHALLRCETATAQLRLLDACFAASPPYGPGQDARRAA